MNIIYRILGYNTKRTNAAVLIQRRYKDFRNQQEEERMKLIESINNTFNNNYYTVITGFKDGNPITYKERIDELNYTDEDTDEMAFYLNERKRIKSKSPKE